MLFKTRNGGKTWDVVSPDLSRESPDVPESIGVYRKPEMAKQPRRGVIYTVAPAKKDVNVIWAGTDDGLIHRTADGGKTWVNVTPPGLTAWSKVSLIDASPFDDLTAYAAVNRFRLDDLKPHVFRTHDGGKTWKEIVKGLPDDPVNAVREDPVRKGLFFAGTERMVHVSFDDGENWQPLRLNMPATSVRDLVVHGDDLVAGTHGRGFWILDDVTPLRQVDAKTASGAPFLYAPQVAIRVRRSLYTDTPLPPEEPAGQNPPDGAILDYVLAARPAAPVTLEILDGKGALVRRFASDDPPEPLVDPLVVAPYWVRPPRILPATPGMHRFVWDLRFPPPRARLHEYPISAIPGDTPTRAAAARSSCRATYTVKLTVDGKTLTRTLTVKLDPRVRMSPADLAQQLALLQPARRGDRAARGGAREDGLDAAEAARLAGREAPAALRNRRERGRRADGAGRRRRRRAGREIVDRSFALRHADDGGYGRGLDGRDEVSPRVRVLEAPEVRLVLPPEPPRAEGLSLGDRVLHAPAVHEDPVDGDDESRAVLPGLAVDEDGLVLRREDDFHRAHDLFGSRVPLPGADPVGVQAEPRERRIVVLRRAQRRRPCGSPARGAGGSPREWAARRARGRATRPRSSARRAPPRAPRASRREARAQRRRRKASRRPGESVEPQVASVHDNERVTRPGRGSAFARAGTAATP